MILLIKLIKKKRIPTRYILILLYILERMNTLFVTQHSKIFYLKFHNTKCSVKSIIGTLSTALNINMN